MKGLTADNVGGNGVTSCNIRETCEDDYLKGEADASSFSSSPQDEDGLMWNPPRGAGLANSSVGILALAATYTPKSAAGKVTSKSILQAVTETFVALNLSQR